MRAYQFYVKRNHDWTWVGTIDAATHADAFRQALLCLRAGDEDRPIRLEEDTEGAYRKAFKPVEAQPPGSAPPRPS